MLEIVLLGVMSVLLLIDSLTKSNLNRDGMSATSDGGLGVDSHTRFNSPHVIRHVSWTFLS